MGQQIGTGIVQRCSKLIVVSFVPPTIRTPYQKWQDTINLAKTDARWCAHDILINTTVLEFNSRLAKSTGYRPLDKKLVKAIVWVESGGPDNTAWNQRPMQIGNAGDPGLAALLGGKEGGDLVLSAVQRTTLKAGASGPGPNILAGTAYLLMRAASYAYKSVPDAQDSKVYDVVVKSGDNLEKIAKANASTMEMLKALNPTAISMIKPSQVLKLKKASIEQVITGWTAITTDFAASRYNSGDAMYKQKLEYCLSLMPK